MSENIAFVIHRYGDGVNGGAEDLCRVLSEHMTERYNVSVITTTSKGMNPWDNFFGEGVSYDNSVEIVRFRVEDTPDGADLTEKAGPYCPKLIEYIADNYKLYKAVIFITYGYYTTNKGIELEIPNSIIMPTAHNILSTREHWFGDAISMSNGILYNSIEEREFVESCYETAGIPCRVTCFGIDAKKYTRTKKDMGNYVVYAGRVSESKNFHQLNMFFLRYKQQHPSDLKLVVLGKIDNEMTIICHDDIAYKGFVSDNEKIDYINNAKVLILPSKNESLSIVLLESFLCKVPVLVNGDCPVIKGQCIRSNAGLYYTDYEEFDKELALLLEDSELREAMGENGRRFVEETYNWNNVVENVDSLICEVASCNKNC
jgi:glycosyltransferase involved in cell wall biosynthesis